ncbi:hypothetical protein Hanom_Chr11g00993511 [Helianthus anomalus]
MWSSFKCVFRSCTEEEEEEEEEEEVAIEKSEQQTNVDNENQDVNTLDEKFQPKDPKKTFDRYVMELGKSHYDKVANKSGITSWRYDHDKKMWLVIRESGHK